MQFTNFSLITTNSKKVIPNSIFICLKGKNTSGEAHLQEAIEKGAILIVSEQQLFLPVTTLKVEHSKTFLAHALQAFYQIDFKNYILIGITGTDGKTTTAKMIYDALSEKYPAMYIGTLGIIAPDFFEETDLTTPLPENLYHYLSIAKNKHIHYIILEASSEGLLDERLLNFKLDVAIFTNLSHEHLNTHKTMRNYFKAKKKLFKLVKENGVIITNIDDQYGRKIRSSKSIITYGLRKGNFQVEKFHMNETCTIVQINKKSFTIPFIGIYNIYNFLACYATLETLIPNELAYQKLAPVAGRMTTIIQKNRHIIIDFAHTPNGLEKLLSSLKQIYAKEITLIFGAQGGKDSSKRPLLGAVADRYADQIILTSEDPKDEDPLKIITDIQTGIKNKPVHIIVSRTKAIQTALKKQKTAEIIVISGKGLETTQTIGGIKYPYSDYETVHQSLKLLF